MDSVLLGLTSSRAVNKVSQESVKRLYPLDHSSGSFTWLKFKYFWSTLGSPPKRSPDCERHCMCTDFICWVGVAFLLRWDPKSCRSISLYICSSTSSSPPSIAVLVQIFPLCLWSAIIFSWQAAALRLPSVTWQKVFPICCFLQFSLEGKHTVFCRISVLLWGGSAFHRPSAGCGHEPCWMLDARLAWAYSALWGRELHSRLMEVKASVAEPLSPSLCLSLVLGTQCPQTSWSLLTFSKAGKYRFLVLSFAKAVLASFWSGGHITNCIIISVRSKMPSVYMSILKDKIIQIVKSFLFYILI